MPNPTAQTPNKDSDWHLLAEFLVPNLPGMQDQVTDHVTDTLGQFGLDPGQLSQILSAIGHSLQNLEASMSPLHLRISVSGMDLEKARQEMIPNDGPDHPQDVDLAARGLGFFLVRRIVSQLQEEDPKKYRLLEVLIYRE